MAPKRQRTLAGGSSTGGRRGTRSSSSSDSDGNGGPRFTSDEAREEYTRLLGRPIARERGLIPTAEEGYILRNILDRRWEQVCEEPDPVPVTVVREFYANAVVERNGISQVRGLRVDYQPAAIRRVLGLPARRDDQEDWSGKTKEDVDLVYIMQQLCVPGTVWRMRVGTTEPTTFPSSALNRYGRAWHLFICANLIPTSHSHEVTVDRAILLFAICNREFVDLGNLLHQGILKFMGVRTTGAIPYGSLIARLARDCGVRWGEVEQVQPPQAPLDHASIWRLPEWEGGSADLWGLGWLDVEEEQQGEQQQQQVEPQGGGSVFSDQQYRRLTRRVDALHDMHSRFAADLAQALGTAFRASGVDVTFPSFGAGAVYPPPDTPNGSGSDDE